MFLKKISKQCIEKQTKQNFQHEFADKLVDGWLNGFWELLIVLENKIDLNLSTQLLESWLKL